MKFVINLYLAKRVVVFSKATNVAFQEKKFRMKTSDQEPLK